MRNGRHEKALVPCTIKPSVFGVCKNPYSSQPPDIWIECTMNKGSNLKSGLKRLLKSERGLLVYIKNANIVNVIRHTLWYSFAEIKRNYLLLVLHHYFPLFSTTKIF